MSREQVSKEIYISTTPHETRLAIVENDQLAEIHYERENEYSLAGAIYNGKVTRVLPGMQSAFVDIGLERDAFLYVTDFLDEQEDSGDFERTSRNTQARSSAPARGDRESGRSERDGGRDTPQDSGEAAGLGNASLGAGSGSSASGSGIVIDASGEDSAGGRKWRGRRGRRRGRGAHSGGGQDFNGEVSVSVEGTGDERSGEDSTGEPEEFSAAMLDEAASEVDPAEGRVEEEGGNRREARRERFRERRAQRGTEREEEHVEEAPLVDASVFESGQPLVLPGESLRKYGAGAQQEPSKAAAKPVVSRPSTEVDLSAGWDGGDVLPGESLSKRRRGGKAGRGGERFSAPVAAEPEIAIPAEEGAAEHPAEFQMHDASEAASHGGTPGATASHAPEDGADAGAPGGSTDEQAPSSEHETPQDPEGAVSDPDTSHEAAIEQHAEEAESAPESTEDTREPAELSAEQAAAEEDSEIAAAEENQAAEDAIGEPEAAETETHVHATAGNEPAEPAHAPEAAEEEPAEGSASFRVDTNPPSEFRLPFGRRSESAAEPESTSADEPATAEPSEEEVAAAARTEIAHHVGHEMAAQHAADDQEIFPAVPDFVIEEDEQETAWVSAGEQGEAHRSGDPEAGAGPQADSFEKEPEEGAGHGLNLQAFAPGEGNVEEETVEDEEEFDFDLLRADSDEPDFESLTEETLESSGDLGDYLRDSQVSHSTSEFYDSETDEEDDEDSDAEADSDTEADEEDTPGETAAAGADFIIESDPETGTATPADGERRRRRLDRRGLRGRRAGRDSRDGREQSREQPRDTGGERMDYGDDGRRQSRRASAQLSDLPIISELLKPGQEILVQIAKEPIAKKGARITSHIALPGRFLVFMPTVNHVGVSRKISSEEERHKLKRIILSEMGEAPGGFIVRTAAGSASEQDLRADIRFLLNLWSGIKQRSEAASSPALIYHDLNLVERVLRDQVTDRFSAIWVDTELEYERVVKFLSRFQPALVRHVKLYTKETPLFEQFGLQDEINKALKSKVWLKSGGSIVINQTEALVAIDINTGKYVGKTARLEDTILKTNLDAIPEIVRQIRLRDLGGIIVIDFIDMDDRRNRNKVMAALEEELKSDRAPSKVLQFNDFGLVAITRKRVKQSLERTLSMPCLTCEGTGMVKNPTTVCNEIYIELRKMYRHLERRDILLRVHPEVVKQLKSNGSKWLQEMEELAGKTIMVKSDPSLLPEQFDIH